jgi:type I restriction enzyme, S subunit
MELTKAKYKQTEVGLIPEDWNIYKFADIGDAIIGLTYSPGDVSNTGKLVHRSSNIQNNKLAYNDNVYVTCSIPEKLILQEDDILICVRNGSRNLIGKSAIIQGKSIGETFGAFMSVFRPKIYAPLVYQYFISNIVQYQINASLGATINQITNKTLNSFTTPLPPTLTEQKAIATALSDVDDLIANLDKLISKKKAIKQGVMQQLLKGKIRLKGFESNSGYKQSELGLIPSDWDVKSLPEVFDYIHGKAHEQFIDKSGNYKVVNSKYVSSEGKVVKYSKQNFCPARQGDILTVLSDLPNGKALAKTFYVEKDNFHAVNQRVCIWRSKKDDSLFLNYVMNRHKYFLKFDDGVTQTHILNHHIEKCPVLVPRNINEQKAIGQCLREMQVELESLEAKKAKYHNIKQGVMQELLTGKTRLV